MIRTLNQKTYISLNLEEKTDALKKIKEKGIAGAVSELTSNHYNLANKMREHLEKLNSTHFLVPDGIVEKTNTGLFQYTQFRCPQQPTILSDRSISQYNETRQNFLFEALSYLRNSQATQKKNGSASLLVSA